jgi:hypothetical protein
MDKKIRFLIILFLFCAGCTPQLSGVGVTRNPTLNKPLPSVTKQVILATPILKPTETLTQSPESTIKVTPQLTAAADFTRARLYTFGLLPGWRFFFSVLLQAEVKGEYYALVGETQHKYKCEVFYKYPKRLVCSGDLVRLDDWVPFTIYIKDTDIPVFSGRFSVPMIFPPE